MSPPAEHPLRAELPTREPPPGRHDSAPDPFDERLAREREADALAATELEGDEAHGAAVGPPSRGVPITTSVLAVLAAGMLFFLAGVEVQKLLGAPGPAPAAPAGSSVPRDDGLVVGEVIAVRAGALYVREPGGTTKKLRTAPDSRLTRGRAIEAGALRPGDAVVVEASPGAPGEDTARSVTVVPPLESRGPR